MNTTAERLKHQNLSYALFFDGKYYRVKNVNGFLRKMRENPDLREAFIEFLKRYCLGMDRLDRYVDEGLLEVVGEVEEEKRLHEMVKNLARLVEKEFPEDWKKTVEEGR